MNTNNKQRLFEVMEAVNPDFKTSTDHYRENNVLKGKMIQQNAYTPEESNEINAIENELKKLGLERSVDFRLEYAHDQFYNKTPRFEIKFFIDKLREKFGHANIDSLLAKTNLDVQNPMVGSQVHGYILRNLRIK